jgi:hypothetical protein
MAAAKWWSVNAFLLALVAAAQVSRTFPDSEDRFGIAAPPPLMLDHAHQNRKQPRPPVCARRDLVEDLPGAQACLLDCILGSAGIPQHMQSLAIEDGQIGQSDRLKFSIAIQADVAGIDVPPQGLGLDGVTGCSHIVSFVRSVGELRLIS